MAKLRLYDFNLNLKEQEKNVERFNRNNLICWEKKCKEKVEQ